MDVIKEIIVNKKLNFGLLSKHDIKNEFEQMINWKRVFESIWNQIRWLISFGQINELALRKILKKFNKNFLRVADNTLDKKMELVLEETSFKMDSGKMTRELQILSNDLLSFYANIFCKGNLKVARANLDGQHDQIRAKD